MSANAKVDVSDPSGHPLEPFELNGIVYDPYAALLDESIEVPPLLTLIADGACRCSEYHLEEGRTCSGNDYRWVPDQADMPPLRFGGAA